MKGGTELRLLQQSNEKSKLQGYEIHTSLLIKTLRQFLMG